MDDSDENQEVWCNDCKKRLRDSTERFNATTITIHHQFSDHKDYIFKEEDGKKVKKEDCQHSTDEGFLKDVTQALFGPYKKQLPQKLKPWQIEVLLKSTSVALLVRSIHLNNSWLVYLINYFDSVLTNFQGVKILLPKFKNSLMVDPTKQQYIKSAMLADEVPTRCLLHDLHNI